MPYVHILHWPDRFPQYCTYKIIACMCYTVHDPEGLLLRQCLSQFFPARPAQQHSSPSFPHSDPPEIVQMGRQPKCAVMTCARDWQTAFAAMSVIHRIPDVYLVKSAEPGRATDDPVAEHFTSAIEDFQKSPPITRSAFLQPLLGSLCR